MRQLLRAEIFPILSEWGFLASFFANYVATVPRIGKKSNSTPFPAEAHVLMYILRRWCKSCGTYYVPNFVAKLITYLSMADYNKCFAIALHGRHT